jgi:tRNA-dependent cyclodipeptide synthase
VSQISINDSIGLTSLEVQSGTHNFWIGISISNKIFTHDNVKSLLLFCLKNTKDKVLVWIPGKMHAINYLIDKMDENLAVQKALKEEDQYRVMVSKILDEIPKELSQKVVMADYDDICTPEYLRQKALLLEEFSRKKDFYERVMEITQEILIWRGRTYTKERAEILSNYVINELPLFINGVMKRGEEIVYTVIPYPGFGKIDDLEKDLIEGQKFPELSRKLQLTNKVGILDISFI